MKFKSSLIALAAVCLGLVPGIEAQTSKQPKLKGYFAYKPAHAKDVQNVKEAVGALSNIPGLPLWNYTWQASRDNNVYTGTMVGSAPFSQHNNTSVPTYVVPIILQTNTIGSGFNPNTGIISTHPGATRFDPATPDYGCLAAPNNVPLTLFEQSPLLANAISTSGARRWAIHSMWMRFSAPSSGRKLAPAFTPTTTSGWLRTS